MAGSQRGRNAGVTGLVDFPGLGSGVKFYAKIFGYKDQLTTTNKLRAGRATTGKFRKVRSLISSGSIVLTGAVNTDGFPLPDTWKGQEGSLLLTYTSGRTKTVAVRVTAATFTFDEKTDTDVKVGITCDIIATPVLTGFGGTQPTTTDPTATDEEQWAGTTKTYDPSGLVNGATRRIDVWGSIANTDAGENQRILDCITAAATPPSTYLKLRVAQFSRDSDDGGEVTLMYGLTTNEEDVTNPRSYNTQDTYGLANQAVIAAVNGSPTTPDDFIWRTETLSELNDQKILTVRTYGNRTTKDDIEYPGTVKDDDQSDLNDTATVTKVEQSATPVVTPTTPFGVLVSVESTQLDRSPGNWKHVWKYSNLTNAQRVTFPNDFLVDDPNNLVDSDQQAQLIDGAYSTPGVPATRVAGLKHRRTISRRVGGTPQKWLHVFEFGRRNTEEDVTMPETVTSPEVSQLQDEATITLVTALSTPPIAPTAPLGQLVGKSSVQIHGGSDGAKWKHTFRYGNTTAAQRIQFDAEVVEDDPSNLTDSDRRSLITSTSDTPGEPGSRITGLKLRAVRSRRLSGVPEQWLHVWDYTRRTSEEDVTMPGTVTQDEVSNLEDTAIITRVAEASQPATPPAPVGQLISVEKEQLHGGSDGAKWRWKWTYGNTTAAQRIQFNSEVVTDDPANLIDSDDRSTITGDSTVPAELGSRIAGLKLRATRSRRLSGTPEQWLHVFEYRRRTTAEDVTMPNTVTNDEVSDLEDSATICLIGATSVAPATPPAPVGQLIATEKEQIHGGTDGQKWKFIFKYGNTTAAQRIQFATENVTDDPSNLIDEDNRSVITVSVDTPGEPGSRVAGLKLRAVRARRLSGVPEQWLHVFEYRRRTSAEDVTMPGTVTSDEISDLEDNATITLIGATSTPPATPPAPVGQIIVVEKEQIHGGTDGEKWRFTFKYGNTTAAQKIQFATENVNDDPSNLEDEDNRSVITNVITTPSEPGTRIAGLKLRAVRARRLSGTPEQWLHVFEYRRRTSAEDITMPGTVTRNDTGDLRDTATVCLIGTNVTPPGIPTAPLGQHTGTDTVQIHGGTDGEKWQHTFHYANNTSVQDATFPFSDVDDDPNNLEDKDVQAFVTGSSVAGSPPPTRIVGLKHRSTSSRRLSGTPEQWRHAFTYARRTTEEDVTMPGTVTASDVSNLVDRATITRVLASGTPVSAPAAPVGVHIGTKITQIHGGTDGEKWEHVYNYANVTEQQKIEFANAVIDDDPGNLKEREVVAEVTSTAVHPNNHTSSLSLVVRVKTSKRLSGTPVRWLHTTTFGNTTTANDIIFPGTVTMADASGLIDERTVTVLNASGTPDAAATVTGMKLTETRSEQLAEAPAARWRHTYTYKRRTVQEAIEFDNSKTIVDPNSLLDAATHVLIQTADVATATDTLGVPSGLKLDTKNSVKIHDATTGARYKNTYTYARRNSVDEVQQGGTVYLADQSATFVTFGYAKIVVVEADSTPDGMTFTGLKLRDVERRQLHDSRWQMSYIFGEKTREQDFTLGETSYINDPNNLEDRAIVAVLSASSTPVTSIPSIPTTTGTLKVLDTRSKQLTDAGVWLHVTTYANNDTVDELQNRGSIVIADSVEGYRRRVSTIVASTATDAAYADAQRALLQVTSDFQRVEVRTVTPQYKLRTVESVQDDKVVHNASHHTVLDHLRGRPTNDVFDTRPATADILVQAPGPIVGGPAGWTYGYVLPLYYHRTYGQFLLRRRYVGDKAYSQTIDELRLTTQGRVNASLFCGYPPYSVMYQGPAWSYSYTLAGVRILLVDHLFKTDSHLFVNDGYLPSDQVFVNSIFNLITYTGFYPNTHFAAAYGLSWPATWDYSIFFS